MADDHYVAQTYLKNFIGPDGKLIPYYKQGHGDVIVGKPKAPKQVCYVPDGSTLPFMSDPRMLEDFLIPLENRWNDNLKRLERGEVTREVKGDIATYLSFLRVNTPTAIRQSQKGLEDMMMSQAKFMASRGLFHSDKFSKQFNDEMVERLMNDEFAMKVDRDYAHARNLAILDQLPIALCSFDWKVLVANSDSFLTSDNPLCLFYPDDSPMVAWFYAPLTPRMALLIRNDPEHSEILKEQRYEELPYGVVEYGRPYAKYIYKFNENLVRHAEEKVLYNQKADWVERLVHENRDWRAETLVDTLPTGDGQVTITRHRVRKKEEETVE